MTRLTPISRRSRQKIMALKDRSLRRTSLNSRSASIVSPVCDVCARQASLRVSGFIYNLFHESAQCLSGTVQFHTHVALGNAQHLGYLAIAQVLQVQQHQRGLRSEEHT